jgi:hypothetical protein
MSGRVFILNSAGHDFRAAKEYTNEPFIILTEGDVPVFNTDRLYAHLEKALSDFGKNDLLLLTGTPLLALMAAHIIGENKDLESISILLWSASRRKYIRRSLGLRSRVAADSLRSTRRTLESDARAKRPDQSI